MTYDEAVEVMKNAGSVQHGDSEYEIVTLLRTRIKAPSLNIAHARAYIDFSIAFGEENVEVHQIREIDDSRSCE